MRRKYLAAAYIAVIEWTLSWNQWDGVIETILAVWMFWGMNLTLMIMVEMEEKNDADHKSHQKRKAPGKRKRRTAQGH
jgi:hypothetical protein|nr:MAG TPA: hypothetical protein [Caudoviricetes sp.]